MTAMQYLDTGVSATKSSTVRGVDMAPPKNKTYRTIEQSLREDFIGSLEKLRDSGKIDYGINSRIESIVIIDDSLEVKLRSKFRSLNGDEVEFYFRQSISDCLETCLESARLFYHPRMRDEIKSINFNFKERTSMVVSSYDYMISCFLYAYGKVILGREKVKSRSKP